MMDQRTVVITGASTGIGEACALYLCRAGFRVFAGVRKQPDGDRLLQAAPEGLTPLPIDVTDGDSIAAALERVADELGDGGLAGLVNNAGISVSGVMELIPIEDLREQLEVNLIGSVATTQAFLPLLRRASGRIVNMGSISGRIAAPVMGPYAISKFAVRAFSDSLRRELQQWGMSVSLVEPGAIATPIWKKATQRARVTFQAADEESRERYALLVTSMGAAAGESAEQAISPVEVAKVVHHALTADKPRTHYLVGHDAKWAARMDRLLPARAMDWLIRRKLQSW